MPRKKREQLAIEGVQQEPVIDPKEARQKVKSALYMRLADLRSLDEMAAQYGFATRTDLIKAIATGILTMRVNQNLTERDALAASAEIKADWNYVLEWQKTEKNAEDIPSLWSEQQKVRQGDRQKYSDLIE